MYTESEQSMLEEVKRLRAAMQEQRKELDRFKRTSITWTVEDLERRASALELKKNKLSLIYDRSKFEDALFAMIKSHDPMKGITWELVEHHLNTLCLKDKITERLNHPKERLSPLNLGKRNKGLRL